MTKVTAALYLLAGIAQSTATDEELSLKKPFYRTLAADAAAHRVKGAPQAILHTRPEYTGKGKIALIIYFHDDENCIHNVAYNKGCKTDKPAAFHMDGVIKQFDAAPIDDEAVLLLIETRY